MNRFSLHRIDFTLLIPSILLVFISLATLFSIDRTLFQHQLLFLLASIFVFFVFLNIDYNFFTLYIKPLYFLSILGLILVLFLGVEVNFAKSWFYFFGFQLQISEVVKPFFILVIAYFLANFKTTRLFKFLGAVGLSLPILFLILRQPDLGTALMYGATLSGMLLMYGFPVRYFVTSVVLLVLPVPFVFPLLKDYQKARILTFFNTTADPSGSSYNAIQSLISIGSGGFFGKGLGEGTQSVLRFLPERHTDFIFASISEGLGFVGGISVICLFCYLLYRIYKVYQRTEDKYAQLIVAGAFFLFLVQMFVNIGMNMGIVPIIGITLPLVSYGGSSLLTTFIILGIVSSISYEFKRHTTLEIT